MPGHTVAITAERSCEMIFALLGIMTAGKAYCPIYPDTTLKCMLAMTKAAELHCVLVPAFQEPLMVYRLNWKVNSCSATNRTSLRAFKSANAIAVLAGFRRSHTLATRLEPSAGTLVCFRLYQRRIVR